MISITNISIFQSIISNTIHFGIESGFPIKTIQKKITCYSEIIDLENGVSDMVFSLKSEKQIVNEILAYDVNYDKKYNLYDKEIWCGDTIVDLVMKYNISFETLFLYYPLSEMMEDFYFFHQMSNYRLFEKFEEKLKTKTILSLLLKDKGITMKECALITGISMNTIMSYCKSNEKLFKANFNHIRTLSIFFKVGINLFSRNVNLTGFDETEVFEKYSAKDIYEKLSLFMISYLIPELKHENFEGKLGKYSSPNFKLQIKLDVSKERIISEVKSISKDDDDLNRTIYCYQTKEDFVFSKNEQKIFLEKQCKMIIVLTPQNNYIFDRVCFVKESSNDIRRSLLQKITP